MLTAMHPPAQSTVMIVAYVAELQAEIGVDASSVTCKATLSNPDSVIGFKASYIQPTIFRNDIQLDEVLVSDCGRSCRLGEWTSASLLQLQAATYRCVARYTQSGIELITHSDEHTTGKHPTAI